MWKILDHDVKGHVTLKDVEEKGFEVCLNFHARDLDKCVNDIKVGLGKEGNDLDNSGTYDKSEFY